MAKPNIRDYHAAGFAAILCYTHEPDRAVAELGADLRARELEGADTVKTFTWDVLRGVLPTEGKPTDAAPGATDPISAVSWFASDAAPQSSALLVHNLHRFVNGIDTVQAIVNATPDLKVAQKMIVALVPPGSTLPTELDRVFTPYDHALPSRDRLAGVLTEIQRGNDLEISDADAVIDAASGLTHGEAENAFALSARVNGGTLESSTVFAEKAAMVRKAAGLDLSNFGENFSTLGGLENLKAFCTAAITSRQYRGVMLTGVPGTGKSAFAKALGNETGLPTIIFDIGRVFGSLVGETEQKIRAACQTIDAMGRCVVMIDEIEKALAGAGGSGNGDSGVTKRAFGAFLTWLNDRPQGQAFVIATCNDYTALPPEFMRSGRYDALFFVDLPLPGEREAILKIHCAANKITAKHGFPKMSDTEGWTGAEIQSLCRLAAMFGSFEDAARYVIPISRSRATEINQLREWAKDRTVPATIQAPKIATVGGRKVSVDRKLS